MVTHDPGRALVDRWRTSAEVLAEVRRAPGLTRVELARRLSLSSASATEVLARLRARGWLTEHRAPVIGRGRPTTVVDPDPAGPQVVAVDLRHEDWRCAVAGLDGRPVVVRSGRQGPARDPDAVLATLRRTVTELVAGHPNPLVAVGVAAPATVADDGFVQAASLGWGPVDLRAVSDHLPVVLGNDATLAGVAEARTGAAAGAATALYLTVEVGIGGSLILDGHPQAGRQGAAGEYGHLPFGDPARPCPCGAHGCWDLEVDGRALARHLGEPAPDDPRTFALDALARSDAAARRAADTVAAALGRGVAGLVNAHDPDVVVLGGLGLPVRAAAGDAFDAAYSGGLMAFRRHRAPAVLDAVHGDDATLRGAAALALDHATSAAALAAGALSRPGS